MGDEKESCALTALSLFIIINPGWRASRLPWAIKSKAFGLLFLRMKAAFVSMIF